MKKPATKHSAIRLQPHGEYTAHKIFLFFIVHAHEE